MKLGELIKAYRDDHDLSQRQFAIQCRLSNGYISMLEKNLNPKTGRPVTPTIPQLKKLADGMGVTMSTMLEQVDDMDVDLTSAIALFDDSEETIENCNIIKIAGRDGSYEERRLTDEQLAALKAILAQMPDASDDL